MNVSRRPRFEILAGCALLALGMWAAIALMLYQARSQAIDRAEDVGQSMARMLAEYQDSSIRAIDLSLQQLRHDWTRDRAGFEQAVGRHEAHLKKENVIQIAVVDAQGKVLYSRLPQPPGLDFSDRSFFQLHKARGTDELDISEPVMGRITKRWALQVTRPLFDQNQRFAGIIVVAVPPPGLESLYNEMRLGPGTIVALARADGVILARVASPGAGRPDVAGRPGLDPAGPLEGHFTGPSGSDDALRLFNFRRLQSYPLTAYVGQRLDTVLAAYRLQRDISLAAGAVATLLLFIAALLLISRAEQRARFLDERERLMLELHDGCIQSIYAIGLTLEKCRTLLEKEPPRAERAIADAEASLNLVIQELRAFISGEQPSAPSADQFMAEIERLIPQSGPRFTVDVDRTLIERLSPEESAHLLRIAREAISNIVRHARASSARLALKQEGGAVRLEVSDDGVGIPPARGARPGLGLHHIQARARKLRGRAQVSPMPEHGTRIAVEFPYRA
jgi:signal transduction histidine kinase